MIIHTRSAFTVIEVVVVITIIAVLAAMFVPRLASAESDTRILATADDLQKMAKVFDYFKSSNGYWPPDTEAGVMPAEMRSAFKSGNPFMRSTPIGGVYNYENLKDSTTIFIAIHATDSVPLPDVIDAQLLDEHIDDGSLATGNFRKTKTGYAFAFNRK